jgi:hypothetical protein
LLVGGCRLEQALLLEVLFKVLLQAQRDQRCVVKMLGVVH